MTDLKTATDLVETVKAELGMVSFSDFADYGEYTRQRAAAEDKAMAELAEAGAKVSGPSDATAVQFAGIRSTSTCGISGALGNWLLAARRRLAQQEPVR